MHSPVRSETDFFKGVVVFCLAGALVAVLALVILLLCGFIIWDRRERLVRDGV